VVYVHEPFNPQSGLKGTDRHFPWINWEEKGDQYALLINDFFSFRRSYKKNYAGDHLLKKLVKCFIGTRSNLRYRMARFQKDKRWLIKDPDAVYLSEYMSKKHHCQVLVLVRHPGAIMASFKRLGWRCDPQICEDLLMQDALGEFKYLLTWNHDSLPVQVGILWLCIYQILYTFGNRNKGWLLTRHEDLCFHPMEGFKRIFEWAGLTFSDKIRKEIMKRTRPGNPIVVRHNPWHAITRDSKQLVAYWKKDVSMEERHILKDITGPVSCHYYDDNSWRG